MKNIKTMLITRATVFNQKSVAPGDTVEDSSGCLVACHKAVPYSKEAVKALDETTRKMVQIREAREKAAAEARMGRLQEAAEAKLRAEKVVAAEAAGGPAPGKDK